MEDRTPEWIPLSEAARRLGVHRNTMRRRVGQWNLTTRRNPRNLREVLVNWAEIEQQIDGLNGLNGNGRGERGGRRT